MECDCLSRLCVPSVSLKQSRIWNGKGAADIKKKFTYSVCECAQEPQPAKIRGQIVGICSLLPPCGIWGSNSGHQTGSRHLNPQSHLSGHGSRDFVKTQSIMSTWIKFQDGSFLIKVQLHDGFWSFLFWTPPPLSFPLLTSGSIWKAGNQKQIYLLSWLFFF